MFFQNTLWSITKAFPCSSAGKMLSLTMYCISVIKLDLKILVISFKLTVNWSYKTIIETGMIVQTCVNEICIINDLMGLSYLCNNYIYLTLVNKIYLQLFVECISCKWASHIYVIHYYTDKVILWTCQIKRSMIKRTVTMFWILITMVDFCSLLQSQKNIGHQLL